jgi:hypothetical protein
MHASEIVDNLIARLDAVKQTGGGYMGRCPANDDDKPSLSFRAAESGDTVLINCFAGCTLQAIADALQIDVAMLLHGEPAAKMKKDKKKKKNTPCSQRRILLVPDESLSTEKRTAGTTTLSSVGVKFIVASGEFRGEAWVFDTFRFDAEGLQHFRACCAALGIDTAKRNPISSHPCSRAGPVR